MKRRGMIDSYGLTHIGRVRAQNQDSFASLAEIGFHVVADGMGGARGGERASQIAVQAMTAQMQRAGEEAELDALVEAVRLANRNIRWEAEQNPALRGMGTTVVAALARQEKAWIVNVGDSRVYRRREGRLRCLTTDHSWVREVGVKLGLSEEQLAAHPLRNVLTQAVGCERTVSVQRIETDFFPGDTLLLCSDGLHGVAGEEAMAEALEEHSGLKEQAEALIEASLARGAPDNVTALLVHRRVLSAPAGRAGGRR